MTKDRYLQSAMAYVDMGKSNEQFIASSNMRLMEDVRSRTKSWAEGIFAQARVGKLPKLEVVADHGMIEISNDELVTARERAGQFPWWQVHSLIGPLNTAMIAFNEKVDVVGIYSTFREGSYLRMQFEKGDVKFEGATFRTNDYDTHVLKELQACDSEITGAHELFVMKTPFERFGLAVEVLDWVDDVIDLRRNPREE